MPRKMQGYKDDRQIAGHTSGGGKHGLAGLPERNIKPMNEEGGGGKSKPDNRRDGGKAKSGGGGGGGY